MESATAAGADCGVGLLLQRLRQVHAVKRECCRRASRRSGAGIRGIVPGLKKIEPSGQKKWKPSRTSLPLSSVVTARNIVS